jgi:hypothetical protein
MPALPWQQRQPIDPAASYVVMYTRLPLQRYRWIPGFLRDAGRIRRQLATTPGLVGYALKANLLRRRFWTVSAWVDQASLQAFVAAQPHHGVTERLRGKMGATRFKQVPAPGDRLPPTWRDVADAVD